MPSMPSTPYAASPDEALLRELREAFRARDPVAGRARESARAAFCWHAVDQDLRDLLELALDSDLDDGALDDGALDDGALVRAATGPATRWLSFEGPGAGLEVEVAAGRALGQVLPVTPCPVAIRAADGRVLAAEADESGFFVVDGVPAGHVRFEVGEGTSRQVTTWVLL